MGERTDSSTHSQPQHYLGWVVRFAPVQLYLRATAHVTDQIGGWVGRKVTLDASDKRRNSYLCRELIHDSIGAQPLA